MQGLSNSAACITSLLITDNLASSFLICLPPLHGPTKGKQPNLVLGGPDTPQSLLMYQSSAIDDYFIVVGITRQQDNMQQLFFIVRVKQYLFFGQNMQRRLGKTSGFFVPLPH